MRGGWEERRERKLISSCSIQEKNKGNRKKGKRRKFSQRKVEKRKI